MKEWIERVWLGASGTLVPILLATLILCCPNSASWSEPALQTGASFFDDFKSFDQKRWFASNGWSSGNFQSCIYVAANVKIIQSSVELALTQRPVKDRPFSCAEVQTRQGYSFGTYEVKMRGAAAPGTVTAFFTYEGGPHEEIDFELLGKDPKAVQLNYFAADGGKHESINALPGDGSEAAVHYAFEWLPDSIKWFIDGKLVREVKGGESVPLPQRPMKIFFSIWSGGAGTEQWLGNFTHPGQPLEASFEFVAFTAAGEACQFPQSIVCQQKPGEGAKPPEAAK